MNRKLWMSPKTKFESVQKWDASEFIPMVGRLVLKNKRCRCQAKNHGLKNPRCTGVCPLKGYCGKCISAEEGRYINTQKEIGGEKKK